MLKSLGLVFVASLSLASVQAYSESFSEGEVLTTEVEPISNEAGPNQFAVVCIVNESGINVNFSYRWGDGSWNSRSTEAGHSRWFSWKYAPGGSSSPRFQITFDYDLRSGRDSRKTYTLDRYAAPFEDCNYGKKYKFMRTGDFIDLYSMN